MIYLILSVALAALLVALIYTSKKINNKKLTVILKVISVVFALVYLVRLFQVDAIDRVNQGAVWITHSELVIVNLLRWFTYVSIVLCIITPFLKVKTFKNLLAFLVPITVILNIIFFKLNLLAFFGDATISLTHYRSIMFGCELVLMGILGGYALYEKIKEKDFKNFGTQLKYMAIVLPFLLLSIFPSNMLWNLFGPINLVADDFTFIHRIYIYIALITPFLITFIFGKKNYDIRNSVVVWLAVAGFIGYFYYFNYNVGLNALPLHLCNTAIVLMLLAYCFKIKSVFYFTFFINVVGAFIAIVIPNAGSDIFSMNSIHFWFNHWYAFFVPILGISLNIFKRPTFKMIGKAIGIFTIYVVFIAFANALINNFLTVDYFFLYGNELTDRFTFLFDIKQNFVWVIDTNALYLNIYWLYDLIVYVVYTISIFVIWYIYDAFFKIGDHYAYLYRLNQVDILQLRELKKKLKGKSLSSPANPEGVNMIKIKNFSKKYAGSDYYAVKDFNLEIHDGEVFGFLGHNGSGKSTTIKSLVGIQSLSEGKIEVCGYDITTQPLQAKKMIGYVSDNHAVYEYLTGREYINYIADLYEVPTKERKERMDKYVELFDLEKFIDSEIKSYSHGMKQKVMVISSLIHDPKIWVLDEPLTGLDPNSAYEIKECMREHADEGNIVFFSSHVIEVVEKICDRIAIISHGVLRGVYDLKQLKKDKISLEELYLSFIDTKDDEKNEIKDDEKKDKNA